MRREPKPRMKVVITNTVALNGGDAAILLGMIKLLRTALGDDTTFVIFDNQPEAAARRYPELDFRELWHRRATRRAGRRLRTLRRAAHLARIRLAAWLLHRGAARLAQALLAADERRALDDYAAADLVVSTGGTYLVEHYSLTPRLFEFQIALALGKPFLLFTQSLGPFRKKKNQRQLGPLLARAEAILVRDEASRRHLLDLRVPEEKIILAADAAFALAAPEPPCPAPGRPLRIAISVRDWGHFQGVARGAGMERFRRAIATLAQHLVEQHRAEVTFLSSCQGLPEYQHDDSQIARAIVATLPESCRRHVTVNLEFHRPEELIRLLQDFDWIVATRMHMAILSLIAGTPVLPVAYEFKTTELFQGLGLGQWVQDIESISAETLVRAADALVRDLPAIREQSRAAAAAEHRRAGDSAGLVKTIWSRR